MLSGGDFVGIDGGGEIESMAARSVNIIAILSVGARADARKTRRNSLFLESGPSRNGRKRSKTVSNRRFLIAGPPAIGSRGMVESRLPAPHERNQVGMPLPAVDIGPGNGDPLDVNLLNGRRLRVDDQLRVLARQQERRRGLAVDRHHPR